MASHLSETSTCEEIILFLRERNLNEVVQEVEANEIDGEDFLGLELREIYHMIPQMKIRKRFLAVWSEVTKMTFDLNGTRVPVLASNHTPISSTLSASTLSASPSTLSASPSTLSASSSTLSTSSSILSARSSLLLEIPTPRRSPRRQQSLTVGAQPKQNSARDRSLQRSPSSLRRSPRKVLSFPDVLADKPYPQFATKIWVKGPISSSPASNSQQPRSGIPSQLSCIATSSGTKNKNSVDGCSGNWMEKFSIPARWEPEVEQGLKQQHLTPAQKNALVRQLCCSIMALTGRVSSHDRSNIGLMLIQQYPFLKGSFGAGHQMWAKKIEERLLNVRRRAARNIKKQFQAEEGVKLPKGKPGRRKTTKLSSTVPTIPDGETEATMESHRKELKEICKRKPLNVQAIRVLMDNTYPKRRRDVLTEDVRVWKLLADYPPLQENKGNELKAELGRILGKDKISKGMREAWDSKKACLLAALKRSTNKAVHELVDLLEDCDLANESEVENQCIIAALPHVLGERKTSKHEVGDLFWKILANDDDTDVAKEVEKTTYPRLISTGSVEDVQSLCIAAEGMVISKFAPPAIVNAAITLLSCFYAFNSMYPKGPSGHCKNVYLFLEYLFLGEQGVSLPMGVENFIGNL